MIIVYFIAKGIRCKIKIVNFTLQNLYVALQNNLYVMEITKYTMKISEK